MPKLKTHSGAKKRFRITGSGKVVRNMASKRHLLTGKSKNKKRSLKEIKVVHSADSHRVKSLLPYM